GRGGGRRPSPRHQPSATPVTQLEQSLYRIGIDMSESQNLGFLLHDYRDRVMGVRHVIALSSDGILVAHDGSLPDDVAQRLAAATSGLVSLLRGLGGQGGAGSCSHTLTDDAGGVRLGMGSGPGGASVAFGERSRAV